MKHRNHGAWKISGIALAMAWSPAVDARPAQPYAAPEPDDQAGDLIDNLRFRTLKDIEKNGFTSGTLSASPWSGDYWPVYAGMIARRYGDPAFPESQDWKINHDYVIARPQASSVAQLSPAEKYDLVVGDPERTLTREMWEEGERYFRAHGKVESWMGLCDGWSMASFMMSRPRSAVEVMAADGHTRVLFYPSDIKALATLLWARGNSESRDTGKRCELKSPPTSPSGRITDIACFDTNPATWHLAVVNQVGFHRKGLIMDASFSYEVWNQPIYGYAYTLFNPMTGAPAGRLSDAVVALKDWHKDPYAAFRAPNARFVAGVSMDVDYVTETGPSIALKDGPQDDRHATQKLIYDLELDQKGAIIGGEWHDQEHPDFLWAPASVTTVKSIGDLELDERGDRQGWDGKAPVPARWLEAVKRSSSQQQPLARIVSALVTLSAL